MSENNNEERIAKAQPRKEQPRRGPGGGGGPMGRMMGSGEKPKNFGATMKKVLKFIGPFKYRIAFVTAIAACSTLLAMLVPRIMADITNEVARAVMQRANGIETDFDYVLINNTLLLLLGFYALSMIFAFAQGFITTTITTTVAYRLRNTILQKINQLPVGFFHSMSHGDVMSRITNDVDTMSSSVTSMISQILTTLVTLITAMAMMLSMSWRLTLIALLMVPFSGLVTLFVFKVAQKYFRRQQSLLGAVNGVVEEILGGHLVVKAFNGEERVLREFDEQNNALYDTAWKAQFLTGFTMPMMNFIGNLGYVAVCMFGAYMVSQGTDNMTVGGIQAFITYIRSFTQPITQLAQISNQLQSTFAAAERVFDFLDEEEERDVDVRYNTKDHPVVGAVSFENVLFAYEYVEKDEDEEEIPEAMRAMMEKMKARMEAEEAKEAEKAAKKAAKKGGAGAPPAGTRPPPGMRPPGGMPGGMPPGGFPGGGRPPAGGFPGGGRPPAGFPGFPGMGGDKDKPKLIGGEEDDTPKKKKSGEPVIKNFSASINAGQKVAIVGPTGAGKTTMVKLLMRFHDLQGGRILIDGHDIARYERRDIRSQFGMVLQDTWLYNGTIMENIRYGKPDATDEDVIRAAEAAQVDHFVRTLPESYNMVLNEETSNISQGQKQLLTIARAILADAKILILDEATSSVDTRTEILIQRAMDNLLEGRTSFIIAHRLSTIRNADLILCMKDGDIVEQGTHDELMAMGGFYAQLYNSQFESVG